LRELPFFSNPVFQKYRIAPFASNSPMLNHLFSLFYSMVLTSGIFP
jgi:hypothetical protein